MDTKNLTIPLWHDRSLTLTLWRDLSVLKVREVHVILGFEVYNNIRLNAMERLDTVLISVGPVGITFSKLYYREE